MPKSFYGHCLFCDDIRDEIGGKISYMGVYGNDMRINSSRPVLLPKLSIAAFVFIPFGLEASEFQCTAFRFENEKEDEIATLKGDISDLPENTVPDSVTRLNLHLNMIPFPVNQDLEVIVRIRLNDSKLELGRLTIQLVGSNSNETSEKTTP